jgi:hypothetical protein
MKTLLIRGADEPPSELRAIVRAGSTEMVETRKADDPRGRNADRVVVWNSNAVTVDDRRLQWPDDRDEIRMLLDTGG